MPAFGEAMAMATPTLKITLAMCFVAHALGVLGFATDHWVSVGFFHAGLWHWCVMEDGGSFECHSVAEAMTETDNEAEAETAGDDLRWQIGIGGGGGGIFLWSMAILLIFRAITDPNTRRSSLCGAGTALIFGSLAYLLTVGLYIPLAIWAGYSFYAGAAATALAFVSGLSVCCQSCGQQGTVTPPAAPPAQTV